MQFDPALKELLLRSTGSAAPESLPEALAGREVAVVARLRDPAAPVEGLRVVARFGEVVTGRASLGGLLALRRHPNVASLKASRAVAPALALSVAEVLGGGAEAPAPGVSGRGVVVGVVDWGCDFAHANFRREDGGSRLLALWDQRGGAGPLSPQPFGYGRELSRERLDEALRSPDPYAQLGYDPADADPGDGTHGTHVLDIAAGNGRAPGSAPGVAPEAELIFVHLDGEQEGPEETLGDSARLLEAVRYVFDRAGDRPAVVNLSLGRHGGPHDGLTLVERGLDHLLEEAPGRAVVQSTGNYFLSHTHCQGRVEPGAQAELRWHVPPHPEAYAELEAWYPGEDELAVEVWAPDGERLARVAQGEEAVLRRGEQVLGSVYHRREDPNNGCHQVAVFLWPGGPAGAWRVALEAVRVVDGAFHAWIERDAPGTQSRFDPAQASPLTTTGTVCNGRLTLATGAYDARSPARSVLPFSSSGPTRDGRAKPELLAPGGAVVAARSSRLVEGARTHDELTAKTGTSMASPHVAGAVALLFERAAPRRLPIEETRRLLIESAADLPAAGADAPRLGAGRVDALAALARLGAPEAAPQEAVPRAARPSPAEAAMRLIEAAAPWVARLPRKVKANSIREGTMDANEAMLEWLRDCPGVELPPARAEAFRPRSRGRPVGPAPETVTYTRKNAHTLPQADRVQLIAAVTALYANNEGSPTRVWGRYADLHASQMDLIHSFNRFGRSPGTASQNQLNFLPWHRWYIWEFEQDLRAINPTVSLPYWDWVNNPTIPDWLPTFSPINTPGLRAPGGNPVPRRTLGVAHRTDGASVPASVRGTDALRRSVYEDFTAALESVHDNVHGWVVDGIPDPMAAMGFLDRAPADFLFFMHHAQVDRLWRLWQGSANATTGHPNASANVPLPAVPWSRRPGTVGTRDMLSVDALGYDYA